MTFTKEDRETPVWKKIEAHYADQLEVKQRQLPELVLRGNHEKSAALAMEIVTIRGLLKT